MLDFSFNCLIYFQEILTDVDDLLYVDTDVLFLTPMEEIWLRFTEFNSSQLAGLTIEAETSNEGWYIEQDTPPYYAPTGQFCHIFSCNIPEDYQSACTLKIMIPQ